MIAATGFWESGASVGIFTAVGAAVGGLIAGVVTWRVTNRSISSSERIEQDRMRHERDEAREARVQERFASAYVDLLDFLTRWEEILEDQTIRMKGDVTDTSLPVTDDENLTNLSARVQAYATDSVRDGMEQVIEALRRLRSALWAVGEKIDMFARGLGSGDISSELAQVEKAKDDFSRIADKVRDDAIADLRRYRPDPN